ncbi:MAG: BrnA antitoxin family protein [Anaerolineales bacterium]|nr:BrnA antitoxin family protein [Anaerolineales bacterium]
MSNNYSLPISDDEDDYPEITQADLDRAEFRVGLKTAVRQKQVTLSLDVPLLAYFQAKAGEDGYEALINETLRRAVEQNELEETLRRIIREELSAYQT